MEDFLKFKKMFTPIIIPILFKISVAGSIVLGLICIVSGVNDRYGGGAVFVGLMFIILGPISIRIFYEFLIIIFSINDTLTEVKELLKDKTTA